MRRRVRVSYGFTLIELLVVMAIIVVTVGAVSFSFSGTEKRLLQKESERLALAIESAQDEAVLQGRTVKMNLTETGYGLVDGAYALPDGLRLDFGRVISEKGIDLAFAPTGESPVFRVVVSNGREGWSVVSGSDGRVQTRAVGA